MNSIPKVFVSGCFDLLHSGHIAFFTEAAQYGELYLSIGSDSNIYELKGRKTTHSEKERLYMVQALKVVKEAWISAGSGIMDFEEDLRRIHPDILFVNADGHTHEKQSLCHELGIQYLVSQRIPQAGLPARSTTAIRKECKIPYRIDLAGGWLDQPYVSRYYPGPVITISIEPDYEFNDRSGMATSTRRKAIELWEHQLPSHNPHQSALILFSYENPPGAKYVSGSQDSLGIVLAGINYLGYEKGEYWPKHFKSILDEESIQWLESRIFLMALKPREQALHVTDGAVIDESGAEALAKAADWLWKSIENRDAIQFGEAMTSSYKAQIQMFPNMVNEEVEQAIQNLPASVLGYKLSGAGGGGYLVLFAEKAIANTLKICIRRPSL